MSIHPEIADKSKVIGTPILPATKWEPAHDPMRTGDRPVKLIHPPSFSVRTVLAGLRTLTQYSDLLYTLSLFRLHVRYKQSALGWTWAALHPVFVFSALLPWIFFSSTISNAVNGLVLYPNLLTKMYFPREIIPLSYLVASLADFCIASLILGGLMLHYKVTLTLHLLYAIPIVIILASFAAAIALIFSTVQVRFRDVGLAMPFLLQVWMFTVPVVYSLSSVPVRWRNLYLLDPVAGLIESFRQVVIFGRPPDFRTLAVSGVIAIASVPLAYAYFKFSEATMADLI
jgi:lipopolysaccharide transport system permease protein